MPIVKVWDLDLELAHHARELSVPLPGLGVQIWRCSWEIHFSSLGAGPRVREEKPYPARCPVQRVDSIRRARLCSFKLQCNNFSIDVAPAPLRWAKRFARSSTKELGPWPG